MPISNALVEAPGAAYAVENEANDYTVSIPENPATTPVRFELDGDWVTMKLIGSDDVQADIAGTEATFEDLIPAADEVSYQATDAGVKETITLDSPPQGAVTYPFRLTLSPGLTPVLTSTNQIEFRDTAGTAKFSMPVPNMQDSAVEPAYTNAVAYTLDPLAAGWRLTITPDVGWLTDSARVYPVAIDPTIDYWDQTDCWVQSDMPNSNRCNGTYIYAGHAAGATRHGLLNFGLGGVPTNAIVSSAKLSLFLDGGLSTGNGGGYWFSLYQPNAGWSSAATWNNSGYGSWTNGGSSGATLSASPLYLGSNNASGWVTWDIKNAYKGWQANAASGGAQGISNRGILVRSDNESHSRQLGFWSNATYGRPYITVNYTEADGDYGPVDAGDNPANDEVDARQFPSNPTGKIVARTTGTCPNNPPGYPCAATPELSYGPWPACGNFDDKYKLVNSYYRPNLNANSVYAGRYMVGTTATIRCGLYQSEPGISWFGYRHVQDRHSNDWYGKSLYIGHQWFDMADFAIAWTLSDPDAVTISSRYRYCYQRMLALEDGNGNVIDKFRAIVFMGETSQRLMTAFPQSKSKNGYCFQGSRGDYVLLNVGPRV